MVKKLDNWVGRNKMEHMKSNRKKATQLCKRALHRMVRAYTKILKQYLKAIKRTAGVTMREAVYEDKGTLF